MNAFVTQSEPHLNLNLHCVTPSIKAYLHGLRDP